MEVNVPFLSHLNVCSIYWSASAMFTSIFSLFFFSVLINGIENYFLFSFNFLGVYNSLIQVGEITSSISWFKVISETYLLIVSPCSLIVYRALSVYCNSSEATTRLIFSDVFLLKEARYVGYIFLFLTIGDKGDISPNSSLHPVP